MTPAHLPPHPSKGAGALSRLRAQRESLSPSLRQVADAILARPADLLYQTITELADTAAVSEATITRLCRKLGYGGFHAFKIALASDVAQALPEPEIGGTGAADLAAHATASATRALEETRRGLDPGRLEHVADAIARAPRVDVFGQGNSGYAAQFFAHKLMRLGYPAVAHPDPHVAAVSAATLPKGGVLIGLSRSGSTLETVHTLRLASNAGVHTVAITNRASSPITQHAAEVLYTSSPEGPLSGGSLPSLVSQLLLLEILYAAVLARTPDAPDMIRRTAESVVGMKY